MAKDTVTVGCRLPTGLILRVFDVNGNENRVELRGQNSDMNGAIYLRPQNCGYTTVDKEFWDEWVLKNKDYPPFKKGAIFVESTEARAKSKNKEMVKEKTGFEGTKPDNKNIEKEKDD